MKKLNREKSDWLTSKEVEKGLKISSCHLMHLRVDGKLKFKKNGKAFLYEKESVELAKILKIRYSGAKRLADK